MLFYLVGDQTARVWHFFLGSMHTNQRVSFKYSPIFPIKMFWNIVCTLYFLNLKTFLMVLSLFISRMYISWSVSGQHFLIMIILANCCSSVDDTFLATPLHSTLKVIHVIEWIIVMHQFFSGSNCSMLKKGFLRLSMSCWLLIFWKYCLIVLTTTQHVSSFFS